LGDAVGNAVTDKFLRKYTQERCLSQIKDGFFKKNSVCEGFDILLEEQLKTGKTFI
jgi:hypothetical protein